MVLSYDLCPSELQMSKMIDYVESMVELCDSDEEVQFYRDWLSELESTPGH